MRPPAVQNAPEPVDGLVLYKTWGRVGLSAIGPVGAVMTLILIGVGSGGCSLSRTDAAFAKMDDNEVTGSIAAAQAGGPAPTEGDLAFARNAASDVLTKGDKDSSQPWENPETGARGSVTPLAQAYSRGRTHLPGFSGELCQWQQRKLAAGRRLPDRPGPLGNSYAEAVEAGLNRCPVAKMPRGPQMKPYVGGQPEV